VPTCPVFAGPVTNSQLLVHSRPCLLYSWAVFAWDITPFAYNAKETDTTSGIQLGNCFTSSIIKTVMRMAENSELVSGNYNPTTLSVAMIKLCPVYSTIDRHSNMRNFLIKKSP